VAEGWRSITIWSNTGRTRFFLIPDDQQPQPGDFVIRTITDRKLTVDPVYRAHYEVTEDQPKLWLESEFENILDSTRGAVDRFIDKLRGVDADRLAPLRSAVEDLDKTFALTGGNIRNACIHAAFSALANDREAITRRDLLDGIAREYQKLAKPITQGEFGETFYRWALQHVLAPVATG
jgi:hypothetical protein